MRCKYLSIYISELKSVLKILKRENANLMETMLDKNKQANFKITEQLEKIQEQSKDMSELKQEKIKAERAYTAERNAKDELRVELKLLTTQVEYTII